MEVEKVIGHIRESFGKGLLQPGDRLPAERRLAEQLGVSRANVRKAYQKLEFYGIAKILPQSGTVLSSDNESVLSSQLLGMMEVAQFDFASLVHVRILLEKDALRLAIENCNEDDAAAILKACEESKQYSDTVERNLRDFAFHQSIVKASHNPVISSLLLVITPDVLDYYRKHKICSGSNDGVNDEHERLCRAVLDRNLDLAMEILDEHFKGIRELSMQV